MTCHRCKKPSHLKAVCKSAAANCAGDLSMVEQLTGTGSLMFIRRGGRSKRNAPKQYELRVQPDQQTFSHMEYRRNQGLRTRPDRHPAVAVGSAVSHATYSQLHAKAPKVAAKGKATKITAMPDTGALMCLMGRRWTSRDTS